MAYLAVVAHAELQEARADMEAEAKQDESHAGQQTARVEMDAEAKQDEEDQEKAEEEEFVANWGSPTEAEEE